jgi:hypothetical protein
MRCFMLIVVCLLSLPQARAQETSATSALARAVREQEQDERMDRLERWYAELKVRGSEAGDEIQDEWRSFLRRTDTAWQELKDESAEAGKVGQEQWSSFRDAFNRKLDVFERDLEDARVRWLPTQPEYIARAQARVSALKETLMALRQRMDEAGPEPGSAVHKELDALDAYLDEYRDDLARAASVDGSAWKETRSDLAHRLRRIEDRINDLEDLYPSTAPRNPSEA